MDRPPHQGAGVYAFWHRGHHRHGGALRHLLSAAAMDGQEHRLHHRIFSEFFGQLCPLIAVHLPGEAHLGALPQVWHQSWHQLLYVHRSVQPFLLDRCARKVGSPTRLCRGSAHQFSAGSTGADQKVKEVGKPHLLRR